MIQNIKDLVGRQIILRESDAGRLTGEITYADFSTDTEAELFGKHAYKMLLSVKEPSSARDDETNPYCVLIKSDKELKALLNYENIDTIFYWYINTDEGMRIANSTCKFSLKRN